MFLLSRLPQTPWTSRLPIVVTRVDRSSRPAGAVVTHGGTQHKKTPRHVSSRVHGSLWRFKAHFLGPPSRISLPCSGSEKCEYAPAQGSGNCGHTRPAVVRPKVLFMFWLNRIQAVTLEADAGRGCSAAYSLKRDSIMPIKHSPQRVAPEFNKCMRVQPLSLKVIPRRPWHQQSETASRPRVLINLASRRRRPAQS